MASRTNETYLEKKTLTSGIYKMHCKKYTHLYSNYLYNIGFYFLNKQYVDNVYAAVCPFSLVQIPNPPTTYLVEVGVVPGEVLVVLPVGGRLSRGA